MHIGSQIFELDPFRRRSPALAPLGDFGTLDLGGGLAVAYTGGRRSRPRSRPTSRPSRGAVREHLGADKRLVLEPGRALVANADRDPLHAWASVKRDGLARFVAVDGGMSDNLRPMLYGAVYEAQIADRFGGGTLCHVAGKHCESGDIIVRDADARPTRAPATCSSRRRPAPTATRWPTTTTGFRARR